MGGVIAIKILEFKMCRTSLLSAGAGVVDSGFGCTKWAGSRSSPRDEANVEKLLSCDFSLRGLIDRTGASLSFGDIVAMCIYSASYSAI